MGVAIEDINGHIESAYAMLFMAMGENREQGSNVRVLCCK